MAKAPIPGRSKTRLVPPLSPLEAAAFSAAFLRDTTDNLALAATRAPIVPYVAYAPAGQTAAFDGHLAPGTQLLLADGNIAAPASVQGLGRSLLHAFTAMLADGHRAAMALNADGPTLPTAWLVQAATMLAEPGERIVLGPAEDGGYYLLGMKAAYAELFADIAWSSEKVAEQTRERARRLRLKLVELPPWYDIDDRSALLRLLHDSSMPHPANPYPAPVSARLAARVGLAARLAQPAEALRA